jgi:flagellar biosynthesis/type III secretory pathway chaperone
MNAGTTRQNLLALKDAIIQEREQAINLNLDGMHTAMKVKEELIQVLAHVQNLDEADRPIAEQIRHENRRNAFLFKSTLGWIRETMEFFGKRTSSSTYSAKAGTVSSETNGRLLSGRI